MLTAHDSDADVVLGLESGANDYVTKPFRINVLLARARAQRRQFELSDDVTFEIGPYSFRPSTKILINPQTGRKVHLTEKETAILKYLYRAGNRAIAREVLLDQVWGYSSGVTTHTLETHVYRLRQKIEPDPVSRKSSSRRQTATGWRDNAATDWAFAFGPRAARCVCSSIGPAGARGASGLVGMVASPSKRPVVMHASCSAGSGAATTRRRRSTRIA